MAEPLRISTPHATFDVSAAGAFAQMFAEAPGLTYAATRFAVFRMMAEHRKQWLTRADVKFRSGGIRAAQIDARQQTGGGTFDARRTVFYKVFPDKIDRNTPPKDVPKLDTIRGEVFSTSVIALGLEQGGTFRSKNGALMALPIGVTKDSLGRTKSKWNTPERFARGGKKLRFVPARGGKRGGKIFWERTSGRGQSKQTTLVPAFRLVPQITRVARFHLMDTWEAQSALRGRVIAEGVDFITKRLRPKAAGRAA